MKGFYNGWDYYDSGSNAPVTGRWCAYSAGVRMSAADETAIRRMIDQRVCDYPPDGHGNWRWDRQPPHAMQPGEFEAMIQYPVVGHRFNMAANSKTGRPQGQFEVVQVSGEYAVLPGGLGIYDTVIRFVSSEIGTKVKLDEYNYAVDVRLAAERAGQAGGDSAGDTPAGGGGGDPSAGGGGGPQNVRPPGRLDAAAGFVVDCTSLQTLPHPH